MMFRLSILDTVTSQRFFVGPGAAQQPKQKFLVVGVPVQDLLEFLLRRFVHVHQLLVVVLLIY